MQHSYNRERKMTVVLEVTFEELQLIQSLAKAVAKLDQLPSGVWTADLLDLTNNIQGVIVQSARDASVHFNGFTENQ